MILFVIAAVILSYTRSRNNVTDWQIGKLFKSDFAICKSKLEKEDKDKYY